MDDLYNPAPKFNLVGLPSEVRRKIYEHLIEDDVRIFLDHDKIPSIRARGRQRIYIPIPTDKMINFVRHTDARKVALLIASPFCNMDAIDCLAAKTTIEVRSDNAAKDRVDILALVDPNFLRYVPELYISPDSFLRLNRALLPRLKLVHLAGSPRLPVRTIASAIHKLECDRCGYGPEEAATTHFENFWKTLPEGRRKRRQLVRLAMDEELAMDLMLTYDRYRDQFGSAINLELWFSLVEGELKGKRLMVNGVVVVPSRWRSTLDMLTALRYELGE